MNPTFRKVITLIVQAVDCGAVELQYIIKTGISGI